MCAGVLAAFPVFPSRPITVSWPTNCPHFTKLSFKCIYSCSFHLNCLILPNQVNLFDSKWVIRSFIKDRLHSIKTVLPIFFSIPCFVVGIPVAIAIFHLSTSMPSAFLGEKDVQFHCTVCFIGFYSYFCSYNYHLREDNRLNSNITINIMIVK